MAPQKLTSASVRYKSRPAARVPFRDDTSLLALRYEQTVQAQPPIHMIPIPPRNPARASRPASLVSLNAAAAAIVVTPPLIAPPQDQHPALRDRQNSSPTTDDWKRDSGAPTMTTSTSTIYEEDAEYETMLYRSKLGVSELEHVPQPGPETVAPPHLSQGTGLVTFHSQDAAADDVNSRRAQSAELPAHAYFESPRPAPIPSFPAAHSPLAMGPPSPVSPTNTEPYRESRKVARASITRAAAAAQPNKLKKKTSHVVGVGSARSFNSLELPRAPPQIPRSGVGSIGDPCQMEPAGQSDSFEFTPITTNIPTDRLIDDELLVHLTFSQRGSVMFGGKRAIRKSLSARPSYGHLMDQHRHDHVASPAVASDDAPATATRTTAVAKPTERSKPPQPQATKAVQIPEICVLPVDIAMESQKKQFPPTLKRQSFSCSPYYQNGGRYGFVVATTR